MLSDVGFENVSPPDAHCVSLIPDFWPYIPRVIPLALEFNFPMLHPKYALIGTNHISDNDVRITRLMLLFFLERLNPSTEEPISLAVWARQERIRKKELSRQQIQ